MRLCMFHPADTPMARGWVGRLDGDEVVHLASRDAATLLHRRWNGPRARALPARRRDAAPPAAVAARRCGSSTRRARSSSRTPPRSPARTPCHAASRHADRRRRRARWSRRARCRRRGVARRSLARDGACAAEGPRLRDRARAVLHDHRRRAGDVGRPGRRPVMRRTRPPSHSPTGEPPGQLRRRARGSGSAI